MNLLRSATVVAAADVRSQLRRPLALLTLGVFAAGALVVCRVAIAGTGQASAPVAAGLLWIVVLFGALMGIERSLNAVGAGRAWDVLVASPASRTALFLGRTGACVVAMLALHALVVPLFLVAIAPPLTMGDVLALAIAVALADVGLALIAQLAGAVAMFSRVGAPVAFVLLVPASVPLLIGAVAATVALMEGAPADAYRPLAFLALYDLVFLTLGVGLFPELATD